jgi:hypothetical protein
MIQTTHPWLALKARKPIRNRYFGGLASPILGHFLNYQSAHCQTQFALTLIAGKVTVLRVTPENKRHV